MGGLDQAELTGAGDGLGPPLDLQFLEDPAVMALDRIQSQEQPCTDFPIGESLGDQAQDFQLPRAEWVDQRRGTDSRNGGPAPEELIA